MRHERAVSRGRAAVVAAVVSLALVLSAASADVYPSRPVRIVVPFGPGGGTDVVARLLAQTMSATLGQPFIIENRLGGGGAIGAETVRNATPDGYTLLFTSTALILNAEFERAEGRTPTATVDRFVPIAQAASDPLVVVVRSEKPWRTIQDLVADVRTRGGRLTYGSPGEGTASHVAMRALATTASSSMTHVPYRGLAPALADLIAGQIDMLATTAGSAKSHVDAGRVRALVTLAAARSGALPNTPTVIEAGLPALVVPSWLALFAPPGTPDAVQARLHDAVRRAASDPEVAGRIRDFGMRADLRVGDAFKRGVTDDARVLTALVRGTPIPLTTGPAAPVAAPPPVVAPPPAAVAPAPAVSLPPPAASAPPSTASAPPSTSPLPPAAMRATFGRYHALVIGNQAYRHLTPLKTPIADAQSVAAMLRSDYGFQDVRVLLDATRADMVRAFDALRRQLSGDDNLLIYYAGHGWLDREADRSYWLGVDAEEDTRTNWLSNADITDTLRAAPIATDVSSLFGGLRRSVLLRAEQTPQYGDLRMSGHDGGDFIFVRKR